MGIGTFLSPNTGSGCILWYAKIKAAHAGRFKNLIRADLTPSSAGGRRHDPVTTQHLCCWVLLGLTLLEGMAFR